MKRTALALWIFLLSALALASTPAQEQPGYLEGRILTLRDGVNAEAPGTAQVRLADGRTVTATLPQAFPGSPEASVPQFEVGDRVELYTAPGPDGQPQIVVSDWLRRPVLLWAAGLFLLVAGLVGRGKGFRAVLATSLSLVIAIGYVVPQILAGHPPILVSLVGVGGILVLAVYFVHGLSWSTTAALIGTVCAVVLTLLLGIAFSHFAHITGLGSEEAMFISADASQVNLKGLFLAGLLIGALGALTDVTIVQASIVREFAFVNPTMSTGDLYRVGMRVGRDHIGSLVNTLVLAYTGAALPLLLLLYLNGVELARALNLELVASEVVHTLVGSVGLMLAVPLTTFLAALLFRGDRLPMQAGELTLGHGHGAPGQVTMRLAQQKRQAELLADLTPEQSEALLRRRFERGEQGRKR